MSIYVSLRTALTALYTNKMRAFLTMLGIIIGVGAVITLSSLGQGVQTMVSDEIGSLGANMLIVVARQVEDAASRAVLTLSDAEALGDPLDVPALAAVAPEQSSNLRVTQGEKSASSLSVVATVPEYQLVRSLDMAMGSFLTPEDLEDRARVAVLGWGTYTELFAEGDYPVGATINAGGTRFRVVGVLEEKGGISPMGSGDDSVYVPMTTGLARLFPGRTLSGDYPVGVIYTTVIDESRTDAAEEQMRELLRERHGLDSDDEDDFQIISQQEMIDVSAQITDVLTLFLGAIAGISLLVGGIGIMNIMLVTVTERTREIGIRKAVGATSNTILVQFLIEALVLTMSGGLIGILLGVGASELLSRLMDVAPEVTVGIVSLAAGVACLVGLTFGVYPAMRAARLHPIEALRHE